FNRNDAEILLSRKNECAGFRHEPVQFGIGHKANELDIRPPQRLKSAALWPHSSHNQALSREQLECFHYRTHVLVRNQARCRKEVVTFLHRGEFVWNSNWRMYHLSL